MAARPAMLATAAPTTVFDRLYAAFQRGFVGVLFALKDKGGKREEAPRLILTVAGVLYDAVQLISFPLSASTSGGASSCARWRCS